MTIKHRKPSAYRKYSLLLVVWTLVGFVLMIHLYSIIHRKQDSENTKLRLSRRTIVQELEEVEEENFQIPPPRGKRSPRAIKRRGPRKPPTAIDEFLDESSDLRPFFFPDKRSAIGPTRGGNESMYFFPARLWLDTNGKPIQAHGGGILFDEKSKTYYWYGENKDGETYHAHEKGYARLMERLVISSLTSILLKTVQALRLVDVIGISCYSSKDLWTWKNEGIVLPGEETNATHDLHKSNVLERPKVLFNDRSSRYVMWMHVDDANYTKASVGVAVSDSPTGPFQYLYSRRPHGFDSRDMTVFKDDDSKAYLIYSSQDNSELHVDLLTDDYTDVVGAVRRFLVGQHREAPALFKHEGTYYMVTSGCTGWAPNRALAHAAGSILGPWETIGSPCVGGNRIFRMTTFFAQGTFVLPLHGLPGSFIFMADRWNPSDLRDSRYVWLPLTVGGVPDVPSEYNFGFPLWSRVSIYWHRRWRLPKGWKREIT